MYITSRSMSARSSCSSEIETPPTLSLPEPESPTKLR
jgi:hypothetical protein